MSHPTYGAPLGEPDLEAAAGVLDRCFALTADQGQSRAWMERLGDGALRVLRRHGEVVGVAGGLDAAQSFGGRMVPAVAVAGVGVLPHLRGQGLATELMTALVEESFRRGFALATLYPSTFRLYEGVGFGRAGYAGEARVRVADLPRRRPRLAARPIREEDEPALGRLQQAWALTHPGQMGRDAYLAGRTRTVREKPVQGVLVEGPEGLAGYVRWQQVKGDERAPYTLACTDLVAPSADAAHDLLGLAAAHATMAHEVAWNSSPVDPVLRALPERRFRLDHQADWMVRLLDVRAALTGRGWPAGVRGELHLHLEDELVTANRGAHVLTVEGGEACVEPGGRGEFRLHVRDLAPLYTGLLPPTSLVQAGALEAPPEALALAATLFAGPLPWMVDRF